MLWTVNFPTKFQSFKCKNTWLKEDDIWLSFESVSKLTVTFETEKGIVFYLY